MRLYVLDTSIAGFAQQQNPTYLNHLRVCRLMRRS